MGTNADTEKLKDLYQSLDRLKASGEDVIAEIEKYLDGEFGEIPYATRENIGCTVDYTAGRNRYMGYLMSLAIYSKE